MDSRHQGLTREHDDGGLLLRCMSSVRRIAIHHFGIDQRNSDGLLPWVRM
jgi:hypothetical protein